MSSPETRPLQLPSHYPALDGVRGVAILLVLFHQLSRIAPTDLAARIIEHAVDFGWIGVQLFFVLSGFLITGILLDSREARGYLRSFYTRRVLRIFPLYFATLIVVLWILPELGLVPPAWREDQLWYWLFLSNWTQPFTDAKLPHLWSLAVEEQFYLVWPFVVMRYAATSVLRICAVVAVLALLGRWAMVAGGVSPEAIYMFTNARMDSLLLGAAAAACLRLPGGPPAWITPVRLWVFATMLAVGGLFPSHAYPRAGPWGQTVGYSILATVFAAAVLALALEGASPGRRSLATRILSWGPMRAFGRYSYGMYLFHKPLHDLVGKPVLASLGLGGPLPLGAGLAYVAAGTAVITAAGALSYHLFERHFLALKQRFRAGRPRSAD